MSVESTPKVWLTTMAGPNEESNLRELAEPLLPYIDGIVAVVHDPKEDDAGVAYLESVKGAGRIIKRSFVKRHDFSMNETLFAGVIQEGDLFIWTDLLERPAAQFVARCKGDLDAFMKEHSLDCLYYYGKAFVVRYNEGMRYQGSPHWGLLGVRNGIELSHMYPDEGKVRLNVRPYKRANHDTHWIGHYAKYWIEYPEGSNHAALGIEHYAQGRDLNQAYVKRETRRLEFRRELRRRGVPLTVAAVKELFLKDGLDDVLKEHLRAEKTLSDFYHFVHGRGSQLKDTHKPSDALPIS